MILILGGNGFIGYNLVKRLSQHQKVRVFDRAWTHGNEEANIEVVIGQFSQADFDKLLEGVTSVYHLISSITPYDGTDYIKEDITDTIIPTIALLDAMVKNRVSRLYFFSSGGAIYGERINAADENAKVDPECVYSVQKATIEHYLHLYEKYNGLNCFVLRIANPYGLEMNTKHKQGIIPIFTRAIISNQEIEVWGDGSNKRDYIFIDDVIDAVEAISQYKGKHRCFNIGTGQNYSINEVISKLELKLQQKANVKYVARRKCDLVSSNLDVTLIETECGWKRKMTLDEGINTFVEKLLSEVV